MIWAQTFDGTTVDRVGRHVPSAARRLDDGRWVTGLTATTEAGLLADVGILPVVEVAPPNDPDHVYEPAYTIDGDRAVQSWTQGADISAENAAQADRDAKMGNVQQAVDTLRQWAVDAAATDVTQGNAVQVLNVVVDRLGVFFDRFADLVQARFDQ